MTTPLSTSACRRGVIALLSALALMAELPAQVAPPVSSPADLAKYDRNKNGVLDADELAERAAAENTKGDTVLLTPFEVSTAKDRGYAAGNTLSGSRADTP